MYVFCPLLGKLNVGKKIQRLHSNQRKIIDAISKYVDENKETYSVIKTIMTEQAGKRDLAQIIKDLHAFIIASFDTVSHTLTSCFYLLH